MSSPRAAGETTARSLRAISVRISRHLDISGLIRHHAIRGIRGDDRPYEKPENTCRIAVLGDSQIAAIATRERDTLVAPLEGMMNRRQPGIHWEVFNFGISASSTAQEIALYRELASRYDPDVVVCAYYVGNDFSDNCDRLSGYPRPYMNLNPVLCLAERPGERGHPYGHVLPGDLSSSWGPVGLRRQG